MRFDWLMKLKEQTQKIKDVLRNDSINKLILGIIKYESNTNKTNWKELNQNIDTWHTWAKKTMTGFF